MGMTIEEAINRVQPYAHPYCVCLQITGEEAHQVSQAIMVLANTSQKYQMMQADYEARLKADMVVMLTKILLEAEENTVRWYVGRGDGKSDDVVLMETINDIIQQKIKALEKK